MKQIRWSLGISVVALMQFSAFGQTAPCPRFSAGSVVTNPPDVYSQDGSLTVNLSYNTITDAQGRQLYCFTTSSGTESPTLHVNPGDHLIVNVKNNLPKAAPATSMQMSTNAALVCGAATMDASSANIHYHGTNVSPTCHSDEVAPRIVLVSSARPRDRGSGVAGRCFRGDHRRGDRELATLRRQTAGACAHHPGPDRSRQSDAWRRRSRLGRDAELHPHRLPRPHARSHPYAERRAGVLEGA